ncbi:MAG: hypothetical protein HFF71_05530 [Oscillospiraceae bacterium]|jgi:ABC-type glycerol-3-phosphate transport system substrate-binding protein|nr:hypothetical protein [Oscillospiraceae bacterium]
MDHRIKKGLTALLAACMLLSLAACGKDQDEDAEKLSGTVFVPEFIDMDLGKNSEVRGGCTDGAYIYLLTSKYPDREAGEEGDTTYSILRLSVDGGEPEPLENFKIDAAPEGYDQSYVYLSGIRAGADGSIWVEENLSAYSYDLPEDFDPETGNIWEYDLLDSIDKNYHIQLDSTGAEITRVDVSGLQEKAGIESMYSGGTLFDPKGNIYVSTDGKIVVLDSSLNVLFSVEDENFWGGELTLLSDGSVGTSITVRDAVNNTYTRQLRTIDPAAKDWGKSYELPRDAYNTYSGTGEYLYYYMRGETLYGRKAEAEEGAEDDKLLNLLDADISADQISFVTFLEDGRAVIMAEAYGSTTGRRETLAVLTPTPRSELPEKTTLTYATMYLSQDERNRIVDFNRSGVPYRIEVHDYSEYSTEEDYQAGIKKLNTEILAGKAPDIINTESLPLRQYGAKGILEDLWPFIENDQDIGGREGLMDRVFTAAEQDGKLYQIFDAFSIATVTGSPSVVGDRTSWTLQDLQDALAKMPEGCAVFNEYNTKSNILTLVMSMNLDSFLNWDTGECRFDSEEFKALLAFCDNFPLEYDWESSQNGDYDEPTRIAEGRQMLVTEHISDFKSIQMQKAIFGGDITYIGFPVEDGGVGSSFSVNSGLAMSASCADKEGAWTYMRQLLLPQYAGNENASHWGGHNGFPSNKADFQWMAEQSMIPDGYKTDEDGNQILDEDGNPIEESHSSWGINNFTIDVFATKQEEYDQIMDLYNQVDRMSGSDDNVYDIVTEVSGSYFAGDRSLDDAASLIQNKVTTYVNESR